MNWETIILIDGNTQYFKYILSSLINIEILYKHNRHTLEFFVTWPDDSKAHTE